MTEQNGRNRIPISVQVRYAALKMCDRMKMATDV